MIVVALIIALAIAAGVVAGGSLRSLERIRIHWWGIAFIALALQAVPISGGNENRIGVAAATLVASYVLLLAVIAVNRRVPGAAFMAAGLLMNLAVVAFNGGMPVSGNALRASGAEGAIVIEDGAKHHLMTDADVLQPLADVIPLPPPFGLVFSVGDVLLYGGLAWWCFAVTRGRFRENRRPPARWFRRYRGKHAPMAYRFPARHRLVQRMAPAEGARSGT
jgi:hypothetical protein